MRLAVSNIAWPRAEDEAVADLFVDLGVTGIEVAPTKVWPNPLAATQNEIDAYRAFWNDRGISIVAAQALLFGRPDLTLFESADVRSQTIGYLSEMISSCARLGAGPLVFGSPKNRRVGTTPPSEVKRIAVDVFRQLGDVAARAGACVVLEANPPEYAADFVTRAAEAIEWIEAVNHPGFQLHLDTGCMTLATDPITSTISVGFPYLRHFHISEPNLDPPGTSGRVDHAKFAGELTRRGYGEWVSLEMRERNPFTLDGLASAVMWVQEHYTPRVAA
jgi:sugar phosphate isomerase/epimerase